MSLNPDDFSGSFTSIHSLMEDREAENIKRYEKNITGIRQALRLEIEKLESKSPRARAMMRQMEDKEHQKTLNEIHSGYYEDPRFDENDYEYQQDLATGGFNR